MNKLFKILGASVLAGMLLAGCGTDDGNVPPPEEQIPQETPDTGVEPGTEDPGLGTENGGMNGQDGTGQDGMNQGDQADQLPGQDDEENQ